MTTADHQTPDGAPSSPADHAIPADQARPTASGETPDGGSAAEALRPFLKTGFTQFLGLEVDEISGDRMVVHWRVREEHWQPYGIVHGGVYCTVIETIASIGAAVWLGERGHVVGVSNQTDFLRAARDGVLRATATPLHRGRLQQLWVVEVRDESDRLIARGQVRLQNIETANRLAKG